MDPAQPITAEQLRELAVVADGRDITRGYVQALGYLQPLDRVLATQAGYNYEVYEELLRDDQVEPALEQRRLAMAQKELKVVPGGGKRQDRKAAEFIEETLRRVGFAERAERMHYGRFFGYSVAEAIWARDGAQVALEDLRVRDRRRFVFDQGFQLKLRTFDEPLGEPLPPRKFWTFSAGASHDDDPYGLGLGHHLYWPIFFKRHSTEFWLQYLERFGKPVLYGVMQGQADRQARRKLGQAVEAIARGTGVVLNSSEVIEAIQHSARGGGEYGPMYDRLNAAIAKIIIGQTMTMDDGSSMSQAKVHMEVREDLIRADCRLICGSFNRSVVRWLCGWNFPGAACPQVEFELEDAPDLKALAERDSLVAQMAGRRLSERYIVDTYGVELGEEITPPMPQPEAPPDGDEAGADAEAGPPAEFADPEFSDPEGLTLGAEARQLRDAAGPLIDAMVAEARGWLGRYAGLDGFRGWTQHRTLDARTGLTEALAPALAVAWLKGRDDIQEGAASFADRSPAYQPFDEQLAFFRRKLGIGTRRWTDLWQRQHDIAFMVAGAAEADLLRDLRRAVDAAISDGESIQKFRDRFDAIVARHGWDYKGGRDWRTRTIYETNLATSYAAGRYEQMQAVKADRPFWRYRHSHASREPRQQHLAWDQLVLHADDKWWDTHFPPNGWGCKCYVETLSQADLDRELLDVGRAPPLNEELRDIRAGGQVVRRERVPAGIDPGFAYTPGKAAFHREADYLAEHRRLAGGKRNDSWEGLRERMEDTWRERGVPDDLGLSEAEKIAIFEYTTDNAFIKEFNRASRDDFGAALETYGGFIATLQSGLSKLKPYQNRVWRGSDPLPPHVMATLTTKGATWSPGQFWSSAWDKRGMDKFPKAIVFDIQSRTGKNISDMSAKDGEYEVLFQPDARFRVEKSTQDPNTGEWKITLTDLGRPDEEG